MLTQTEIKKKEKDFKQWARNDARHYVFDTNGNISRSGESITDYFAKHLSHWNTERLVKQFNYSQEQADYIVEYYNTQFWRGYEYWKDKKEKLDNKLAQYTPILKEAEEFAKTIDVSDIKDGFPCGDVIIYADPDSELADILGKYEPNTTTPAFKYKLPISLPSYGQCISFDERICSKVKEFLQGKGINCLTYSWID